MVVYLNQQHEQTMAKHSTNVVTKPIQVKTSSWCWSERRFSTCLSYTAIRSSNDVNRLSWSLNIVLTSPLQSTSSAKRNPDIYLRNRKHYSYRNTRGSLGERGIEVGTRTRRASVSTQFRFHPNFHEGFYNVWEHGGKFSISFIK